MPKRVIVMDLAQKNGETEPHVFINPKILWASDEIAVSEEGCLSVPDIWENVERPARIKAEYLDRDGKPVDAGSRGLLATCLQHEMDHLEGVLFLDHLSRLKRSMALRKLAKPSARSANTANDGWSAARSGMHGPVALARHDPPPRLHGHAGFRGADAGRLDRPGPRHRRRLYAARAAEGPRARRRAVAGRQTTRALAGLRGPHAHIARRTRTPQAAFARARCSMPPSSSLTACMLPKPILDAPRLGCFNLHGSLLPRWRGAAPIQRAIMAGDAETGVMVMRMEEGLDTGPVLMAETPRSGARPIGELA